MIAVTAVICRLAQKYAQMQHPLFGRGGRCCMERLLTVRRPLTVRSDTCGGDAVAPGAER
jgi:hypothetical protein